VYDQAKFLSVGEIARRTGLTVRTLHHYDQIGLLRPTARSPAGYRLYGPAEVRRLQHIASLRALGLSLEAITRCLDQGAPSLPDVLDDHLARLEAEVRETVERRDRLVRIRAHVDEDEVDLDAWLTTIHESLRFERHFTAEQLDELKERRDQMGLGDLASVERAWVEIFDELDRAVYEGLPPDAPEVEAVARRARALVREFTGGDAGLEQSLGSLFDAEGTQPLVDRGMAVRPEVWAFLGAAMGRLES
jgi:DNA-binding transcriptional MerR regulator